MVTKTIEESESETQVRYIVNHNGETTEVVLPVALYERLLESVEDTEDIRTAEELMERPDFISWEEAKKQLGV